MTESKRDAYPFADCSTPFPCSLPLSGRIQLSVAFPLQYYCEGRSISLRAGCQNPPGGFSNKSMYVGVMRSSYHSIFCEAVQTSAQFDKNFKLVSLRGSRSLCFGSATRGLSSSGGI